MTLIQAAHSLKKAVYHTRSIPKTLNYYNGRAVAYTDGSCFNPGRRNPKAGFGVFWYPGFQTAPWMKKVSSVRIVSYEPKNGCAYNFCGNMTGLQTSGRAELCAVSTAIMMAYLLNKPGITIKTDCKFVITSYKMPKEWRRKFINTRNSEFLVFIDSMEKKINVTRRYVIGHANKFGNEEAHKLAEIGSNLGGENQILMPNMYSWLYQKVNGSPKSINNN